MKSFTYHKPTTIADAVTVLSASDASRPLAGGMTLLPTMKQRLSAPEGIVDLSAIAGLKGIILEGDMLVIGAMTRHADVAHSAELKKAIPSLVAMAGLIGDRQVRHMGTIGGSLANSDPAADYPAALLALNGTVTTNKRKIAADQFFKR